MKIAAKLSAAVVLALAPAGMVAADDISSPPPTSGPAGRVPAGSVRCRECHGPFYEKWATSYHGLAMQPYSSDFARGRLTAPPAEIRIGSHRYQAYVRSNEGWIAEHGSEGEKQLPIAHVLGGKNVYYFLTPTERGRLQTLPLAYDVRHNEWFDMAASGVRHSFGRTGDPLHWTEREYTFNTSCYGCHVSQFSTNYIASTDSYDSAWAEYGINCETCHGAGEEHVQVCRRAVGGEPPADLKIISLKDFRAAQTNALCASCHAKMVVLTTSFAPGERFFDHFDLITLEHSDFFPDGRDLGENYTYTTWRLSLCAQAGGLDCLHCHTSSGRFRFHDDPDRSCRPCHEQRVRDAAAHSRHPSSGEGSRCIGCHMPTTEFARMRRSDHSMRPPMPAATIRFQSPNACNLCHADKDAAWADQQVRRWHARDYQAAELYRAGLIEAARQNDWSRLPDMLAFLSTSLRAEVFTTALIRLLRSCENEEKWPVLIDALSSPSPLVRGAAAEALGGHFTPESVGALVAATQDEYRLVRIRAAEALAFLPRDTLPPADRELLARANSELESAMRARPDDAGSPYNLGNYYLARGELDVAIECFQRSHHLDPRRIEPLVNLATAHHLAGSDGQAEAALRRALQLDPLNVAANVNLGLLLGELARAQEAETAFRTALAADPRSAVAAYNLAITVAQDRLDEAIHHCRQAAELRPDQADYAYTLAFYLERAGKTEAAIETLQRMLRRHPNHMNGCVLLASSLERQGRVAEAIDLYRRMANDPRIPVHIRARFEARLGSLSNN